MTFFSITPASLINNYRDTGIHGIIGVGNGGTGRIELTPNSFLVGNSTLPVLTNKPVPAGDVIGSTDTQTLINKTLTDSSNNILARGLLTDTGFVSTFTTAPTPGQILIADSASSASWQSANLIHGSEFEYFESLHVSNTTLVLTENSLTGMEKLNFTLVKPAGLYKISWSFNYANNSNSRDFIAVITVNSDIKMKTRTRGYTTGSDTDDFAMSSSGTNQNHTASGFFYYHFTNAEFKLLFGRSLGTGNESVSIAQARIEIIKVS